MSSNSRFFKILVHVYIGEYFWVCELIQMPLYCTNIYYHYLFKQVFNKQHYRKWDKQRNPLHPFLTPQSADKVQTCLHSPLIKQTWKCNSLEKAGNSNKWSSSLYLTNTALINELLQREWDGESLRSSHVDRKCLPDQTKTSSGGIWKKMKRTP